MAPTTPSRAILDAFPSPLHPVARETLQAAIEAGWADPRRLHREGRTARRLLDGAREILAGGLGLRPEEVTLHPSGPHALTAGLHGLARGRRRVGAGVVTSAIDQAQILRTLGDSDLAVPVDHEGHIDPREWSAAVARPGVALAVTAAANLEVGTEQDVPALHAVCADRSVPLLLDVAASWGRLPLSGAAEAYAGDAASFAGPPLGVLGVRTGTRCAPAAPPSTPERGHDLSGPWLPVALAAAEAWRQTEDTQRSEAAAASALVSSIRACVETIRDVEVVGDPLRRLPHVLTLSALYVDGEALVSELDGRGYAVASGSACTSDTLTPSHVLAAMGALTHGNIRITLPLAAVAPEREHWVARFCADLPDAVDAVRARLGTGDL